MDHEDDYDEGDAEATLRKVYEAHEGRWLRVGIFVAVLAILYVIYLRWVFSPSADGLNTITIGGLFARIFILALIAAVPFFVMAWLDPVWRSKHAASIAALSWVVVFTIFSNTRWGATCPAAAMFFFIPISIGALVGHNIGMFNHPETFDQEELDR